MGIISIQFVLTLFISVSIFYLLPIKFRQAYLLLLSGAFIASFSYYILGYVLIYAGINYAAGIKTKSSTHRTWFYTAGLVFNIGQLILLKYSSFAIDPVLQKFNSGWAFASIIRFMVPIGVSYFTLQGIGYLINIRKGWEKPETNFLNFLLYIIFFPKFLSGPIERSNHFLPQIRNGIVFKEHRVTEGLKWLLIGFFKKIVIANQLLKYINTDFYNQEGPGMWITMLLQPLYLYFDFAGYTDIAIGCGKLFGIELLPNFNKPFLAENVTTFWKRFHTSLSFWFNDYIFKQLSFKLRRWGVSASIIAIFLTWSLFGVWHGAGWNFMFLGICQAIAICYEFFTKRIRSRIFSVFPDFIKIWVGRLLTYLFYAVSLVFFFAPDLNSAFAFLSGLWQQNFSWQPAPLSTIPISLMISVPIVLLLEIIEIDYKDLYDRIIRVWSGQERNRMGIRWTIYGLMITSIYVTGTQVYQFIYVNF